MRWRARVGDRVHQVELGHQREGRVTASVGGRAYTLDVTEPQPGVYSILTDDGASYEAFVQERQGASFVRLEGRVFEVLPDDTARLDVPGAPGSHAAGTEVAVRAVMPGRVLRVMVRKGQTVAARQGLVVLEAMKMENEVTAPRDGTVRTVAVEPGRTVETGELLVVIE